MLYELQKNGQYEIAALLTTVTESYERISMHGVRNSLLERQAESLGLPLCKMYIPVKASNDVYEANLQKILRQYQAQGVNHVAFGDLFLADIKEYRLKNLSKLGMAGVFPLWGRNTSEMVKEFIQLGFKAVICCIDPKVLDPRFAGRTLDEDFLRDLPSSVDPCGENGEFHSFVFDGPLFKEPIKLSVGEIVSGFPSLAAMESKPIPSLFFVLGESPAAKYNFMTSPLEPAISSAHEVIKDEDGETLGSHFAPALRRSLTTSGCSF